MVMRKITWFDFFVDIIRIPVAMVIILGVNLPSMWISVYSTIASLILFSPSIFCHFSHQNTLAMIFLIIPVCSTAAFGLNDSLKFKFHHYRIILNSLMKKIIRRKVIRFYPERKEFKTVKVNGVEIIYVKSTRRLDKIEKN